MPNGRVGGRFALWDNGLYNVAMISTHSFSGVVWLDMESPNDEEVSGLVKRYGLHPLVGEELKRSSALAKVDFFKDYMLVVLTLPVRIKKGGSHEIVDREIDFVVGRNFLITSRTETIEQLEYFGKIFDANSILNKDEKIAHAGFLFYYMVKRIYAGMIEDLENIKDALSTAETRIYTGQEREMVEVLSDLSRELIDIKQTARMHREIWEKTTTADLKDLFGTDFAAYLEDVKNEFGVIHELIGNVRELLADLRETNDSLLNSKQNEIMKVLTLVAFIFYPLTFIASIFTIPGVAVPLTTNRAGWWIILASMVVVALLIWRSFRKRRWL